MVRSSTNSLDPVTIGWGSVSGFAAFLAGYVLTYAWRAPDVADSLRGLNFLAELLGAETVPTWKGVAWLFYSAHGVATRFPALGGGTRFVNLIEQSGDGTVALLYVLVPVLLMLAGAMAAVLTDAGSPKTGAASGAMVIGGYLAACAVGTVVFAHAIGESGTSIAPDPVTGVLLAGMIYPVTFGALGGAVTSALR